MANVTMEEQMTLSLYVNQIRRMKGAPDELERLDALSVDFVRDTATGRMATSIAQAVARAIDERSNAVCLAQEEAAAEEERYNRTGSIYGDDGDGIRHASGAM